MKKLILSIFVWLFATVVLSAAEETFRYQVLASDEKVSAGTKAEYEELFEAKSINVAGFRTARVFIRAMESDFMKNEGKFDHASKLRIRFFHKTPTGSASYLDREFPMTVRTCIDGWVEVPIIGPELRFVVWGDGMPREELEITSTIYLLK